MDKTRLNTWAVQILRWTVGVILLLESAAFLFGSHAGHAFAKTHLPLWIRPALGGVEIVASAMFLVPPVEVVGGYSLLAILCLAVLLHVLHGWYDVGSLLISAAAVLVCTAASDRQGKRP